MKVLCSVHDTCSKVWSDPMAVVNAASAIRSFTDAVNGRESDLSNHPEHFMLYKIGTFHPDQGIVVPDEPECLVRAIDVKNVLDDFTDSLFPENV